MREFLFWTFEEHQGKYYAKQVKQSDSFHVKTWILKHDMECYLRKQNIKLEAI